MTSSNLSPKPPACGAPEPAPPALPGVESAAAASVGPRPSLRATVVVPTYHRPDELRVCLSSLLAQTVQPHEVVVVDDGDLQEWPLEREFRQAGIRYVGHRKSPPGLTASRNAGIRLATGDVVFFVDDDTEMLPDYLERILETYAGDTDGGVGGIAGAIVESRPMRWFHRLRWAWDVLFLASGFREGSVLPSGFCVDFQTTPYPVRELSEVRFFPGGASSFRREVFAQEGFSEEYRGYGLGEDKDFCVRVGRRWRLLVNPAARIHHYESPKMRFDKRRRGRELVRFRHRFFRDHVRRGPASRLCFALALFGYVIARTLIALLSFDRGEWTRVYGIFEGVGEVLIGRRDAAD